MSDKGKVLLAGDNGVEAAGQEAGGGEGADGLRADPPLQDSDELRSLITEGRERGYLTFEQIASTLEEVEVTKEQVQLLHGYLVEHGVDVIAAGWPDRLQGDQGGGPSGPG